MLTIKIGAISRTWRTSPSRPCITNDEMGLLNRLTSTAFLAAIRYNTIQQLATLNRILALKKDLVSRWNRSPNCCMTISRLPKCVECCAETDGTGRPCREEQAPPARVEQRLRQLEQEHQRQPA